MFESMFDRRNMLALLASALAAPAAPAIAQQMSRRTAFAFSFAGLDGHDIRLASHAGKPILIVNTASQCGYTPQLAGLQELWMRYRSRGLLVVGVPSNDFGGQEPGTPSRNHENREPPVRRELPARGKSRRERRKCAPVLQMGRDRASGLPARAGISISSSSAAAAASWEASRRRSIRWIRISSPQSSANCRQSSRAAFVL